MNLALTLFFCTNLVAADPTASNSIAVDTVVVCDPALREALEPWVQYRQRQGHEFAFVTDLRSADEVHASIRRFASSDRLRNVVLVGDVGSDRQAGGVPTELVKAKINVKWGSESEIASDNRFADLNEDNVPDLTIGRLSADTPDQLTRIVEKIIAYEQSQAYGPWRRRVNFVAGVGGFGAITDAVLESATRAFISRGIPNEFRTSMTYASWRSPYCPDPRTFRQAVLNRLNEGCLCWIYIGHGYRHGLDWIRVPTGRAPILQANDVVHVQAQQGSPIAVFLSCYAGAFDSPEDCLAEKLLRRKQGPIAVLAGSRVTMPYGMAVMSNSLMHHLFQQRQATMGEIVLAAKRELADPKPSGFNRRMLDTLAMAISPNSDDLEGERQEHIQLFNLLGDPLLRVKHPQELEVTTAPTAAPGQSLTISCRSAVTGDCYVELVCQRGQFTHQPTRRTQFDSTHEGMKALTAEYLRANNDCFAQRKFRAEAELFETQLTIPQHVVGRCHVRVFVAGEQGYAMGAANLRVAKPQPPLAGTSDSTKAAP
ncbi:MAG: C25 family cysteine peptidase [Pirellulaceae bacterium]|nr:C25 family cysteine peptidase [Pirellulaceae bacterium]